MLRSQVFLLLFRPQVDKENQAWMSCPEFTSCFVWLQLCMTSCFCLTSRYKMQLSVCEVWQNYNYSWIHFLFINIIAISMFHATIGDPIAAIASHVSDGSVTNKESVFTPRSSRGPYKVDGLQLSPKRVWCRGQRTLYQRLSRWRLSQISVLTRHGPMWPSSSVTQTLRLIACLCTRQSLCILIAVLRRVKLSSRVSLSLSLSLSLSVSWNCGAAASDCV